MNRAKTKHLFTCLVSRAVHIEVVATTLEKSQLLMDVIKLILAPSCHEGSHFRFIKLFFVL